MSRRGFVALGCVAGRPSLYAQENAKKKEKKKKHGGTAIAPPAAGVPLEYILLTVFFRAQPSASKKPHRCRVDN